LVSVAARALVVLGGSYHDFDGFASVARAELGQAGFSVEVTCDLDVLCELPARAPELLVLFTCLDEQSGSQHGPAALAALGAWLRAGGALLALHSATVAGAREPELAALLGGAFAGHPPKGSFRVQPTGDHPSTRGLAPFEIEDELYRHRSAPDGEVHLVADDQGSPVPVAWSRREHAGHVYYLGLGHDRSAWTAEPYRQLLARAARWLAFEV
jgi:type 1 glutamine amidotransferase